MNKNHVSIPYQSNSCDNTDLHFACIGGDIDKIRGLLDKCPSSFLYKENQAGLSPIVCISDLSLRNKVLQEYPHVAEAFANQVMKAMRKIFHKERNTYENYQQGSVFQYGFYRAKKYDIGVEISMDYFSGDSAVKILKEFINQTINYFERFKKNYHGGLNENSFQQAQDILMIKSIYSDPIMSRALNVEEPESHSQNHSKKCDAFLDILLTKLNDFDQLLWDLVLLKNDCILG